MHTLQWDLIGRFTERLCALILRVKRLQPNAVTNKHEVTSMPLPRGRSPPLLQHSYHDKARSMTNPMCLPLYHPSLSPCSPGAVWSSLCNPYDQQVTSYRTAHSSSHSMVCAAVKCKNMHMALIPNSAIFQEDPSGMVPTCPT